MKICLVVRQDTRCALTHKVMDDRGLFATDSIRFGEIKEVDEGVDPLVFFYELFEEFEHDNPDYRVDRCAIRREDNSEIDCSYMLNGYIRKRTKKMS